jgi:hypothetical protein
MNDPMFVARRCSCSVKSRSRHEHRIAPRVAEVEITHPREHLQRAELVARELLREQRVERRTTFARHALVVRAAPRCRRVLVQTRIRAHDDVGCIRPHVAAIPLDALEDRRARDARVEHFGGDVELREPAHDVRRVRVLPRDARAERRLVAEQRDAQHTRRLLAREHGSAETRRVDVFVARPRDARARARLPHLANIEHVQTFARAQLDVVFAAPHDRTLAERRVGEVREAQRELTRAEKEHSGAGERHEARDETRRGHPQEGSSRRKGRATTPPPLRTRARRATLTR